MSFPGGWPPTDPSLSQPVDLLVVDQGSTLKTSAHTGQADATLLRLLHKVPNKEPFVILDSWPAKTLGWEQDPTCKLVRTQWQELGHTSRHLNLDTKACGGAINQVRLLVAQVSQQWAGEWVWPSLQTPLVPRPMGDPLTLWGLLPRRVRSETPSSMRAFPPQSEMDPMPNCMGAWISAPHRICCLQPNEICRALGVPKETLSHPSGITTKDSQHTTSVFVWEALRPTLQGKLPSPSERVELQRVHNHEAPFAALSGQPTESAPPPSGVPTTVQVVPPGPHAWRPMAPNLGCQPTGSLPNPWGPSRTPCSRRHENAEHPQGKL